jgi:hypothetical protein
MPPRRAATTTVENEETEPSDEKSATIADVKAVVSEAIDSIKGMLGGSTESTNPTGEVDNTETTEEKLPSPRRVEIDTEKSVRDALSGLTVNIHNASKEEKAETKEPEQTPGGVSKLTRFIWGKGE